MLGRSNRREFLKKMGLTTAGTLIVPAFLQANSRILQPNGKRLVVIQLSGGNDGLNTIIPYRNELLYSLRPQLAPDTDQVLKLTDDAGLNGNMTGFRALFDEGDICILNSVGYPNPNRSHFRSMDIWQTASSSNEYLSTGWLGRYLDSECSPDKEITAVEINNILSLAMKGEKYKGLPVTNIQQFYQSARSAEASSYSGNNPTAEFLYKTMADTRSSASYLYEKNKIFSTKKTYPDNIFGNQLKQVAEMIMSGVESPVYYVSLGGFDTHNNQHARQGRLLKIYSDAIKVFAEDLKQNGEWTDTLVMTFSEFGRRVKQNASGGTDHGKANNLFIMGGNLKSAGFYNELPDLSNLNEGDLDHQIDFRQVYSTLLNGWLGADAESIVKGQFDRLKFI
ncbi:DUF1501 domain-containing protein [Marinoscillum sp. MHG1-6]|uniref:DUF1501 domain-containing protein n=1 Tax=Marinoscillum sp. MHG1-6 TaxID=2959627 RepID=UPI0021580C33|nr:DUF1501 domain-containing protein [Marinoscillum sp. MHG1-6]